MLISIDSNRCDKRVDYIHLEGEEERCRDVVIFNGVDRDVLDLETRRSSDSLTLGEKCLVFVTLYECREK